MTDWHVVYDKVVPYIVRIETPEGFGSGFLFAYNQNKTLAAFATAAHVVQHADQWKLPIKLTHHVSGREFFVTENQRIIDVDAKRDSASILIPNPRADLPEKTLPMADPTTLKRIGVEVAWAGYPVIVRPNLCLFTGSIAAHLLAEDTYLIDGVAINGVSGGPVFTSSRDEEQTPELLGTISGYMPNRQATDTLPGMLWAHDLTSFVETIKRIRTLDEARAKREKEEQEKRQAEVAGTAPPAPTTTPLQEPPPPKGSTG